MPKIASPPPAVDHSALIESWPHRVEATDLGTIGVEEEFILVGPTDPTPVPSAAAVLAAADGDPRLHLELPPCQVEIATRPVRSMAELETELVLARRSVATWSHGMARPISAAVHPQVDTFADPVEGGRARRMVERYGSAARHQLVGALQVHVGMGGADRLVAVHDGLRTWLPHLAALAAAAPFASGCDQGVASVRPLVADRLPRHGIPPILGSWPQLRDQLRWGAASGAFDGPDQWWWDLRPNLTHATLEVRVPDAQPRVSDTMAVVDLTVAVVLWLADRHGASDLPPPAPTWRIDENRWSAFTLGLDGDFVDVTGAGPARRTRDAVADLIDRVEPWSQGGLARTRSLLEDPAHRRLRAVGPDGAVDWLAEQFLS